MTRLRAAGWGVVVLAAMLFLPAFSQRRTVAWILSLPRALATDTLKCPSTT